LSVGLIANERTVRNDGMLLAATRLREVAVVAVGAVEAAEKGEAEGVVAIAGEVGAVVAGQVVDDDGVEVVGYWD
jgi:hypothetical protein